MPAPIPSSFQPAQFAAANKPGNPQQRPGNRQGSANTYHAGRTQNANGAAAPAPRFGIVTGGCCEIPAIACCSCFGLIAAAVVGLGVSIWRGAKRMIPGGSEEE